MKKIIFFLVILLSCFVLSCTEQESTTKITSTHQQENIEVQRTADSLKKNKDNRENSSGLNYVLLLLLLTNVAVTILFFIKTEKRNNENIAWNKEKIRWIINSNKNIDSSIDSLLKKFSMFEKQLSNSSKVISSENNIKTKETPINVANNIPEVNIKEKEESVDIKEKKNSYIYFKPQDDMVLKECREDRASYRAELKETEILDVEFYGDERDALDNFSAVILSVCDYKGNSSSALNIKTIAKGQVKKDDNGKWRVINKVKVELI